MQKFIMHEIKNKTKLGLQHSLDCCLDLIFQLVNEKLFASDCEEWSVLKYTTSESLSELSAALLLYCIINISAALLQK